MQINLKLTSKQQNGKKKNHIVNFINPNASNEDLATFALALMDLSENNLTKAQKVKKKDLSDYYILGTDGDDWLEVGNEWTVVSGAGNDTLVFGADIAATIRDFSNDDCISLGSAVDFATFNDGVLTLGGNVITLENVSDIDAFSEVTVYNGASETTLGELIFLGKTADPAEVVAYIDEIFSGENTETIDNPDFNSYVDAIFGGYFSDTTDNDDFNSYIDNIFDISAVG